MAPVAVAVAPAVVLSPRPSAPGSPGARAWHAPPRWHHQPLQPQQLRPLNVHGSLAARVPRAPALKTRCADHVSHHVGVVGVGIGVAHVRPPPTSSRLFAAAPRGAVVEVPIQPQRKCPDCGRKFNVDSFDKHTVRDLVLGLRLLLSCLTLNPVCLSLSVCHCLSVIVCHCLSLSVCHCLSVCPLSPYRRLCAARCFCPSAPSLIPKPPASVTLRLSNLCAAAAAVAPVAEVVAEVVAVVLRVAAVPLPAQAGP